MARLSPAFAPQRLQRPGHRRPAEPCDVHRYPLFGAISFACSITSLRAVASRDDANSLDAADIFRDEVVSC
jgi:hypothetical protein